MSDNPATPGTAMPEPHHNQNLAGQTSPAPGYWSHLHSPTAPSHSVSATSETVPADVTAPEPSAAAAWPEGWTVISPVGSIATDVGVTFSLAPASLIGRPVTVRCTSCDWESTAPQPVAVDSVRVHALGHIADPRPRISHFPQWLLPRSKGRR